MLQYRTIINGEEHPDKLDYVEAAKKLEERMSTDAWKVLEKSYSDDIYIFAEIRDCAEYFAEKLARSDYAKEKLIEARDILQEAILEMEKKQ